MARLFLFTKIALRSRRKSCLVWLLMLSGLICISGCANRTSTSVLPQVDTRSPLFSDADKLVVVDCLLPGRVQRLGNMEYLTPRSPAKLAAGVCEIRGGEYTAYDRANYATALKVWLQDAQAGDAAAQTYVGEIYEQGLGTLPDYQQAQFWYHKAANQGFSRAQANLGYLYETGLGVSQDRKQALNWYRKASGLEDQLAFASELTEARSEASQKIQILSQQLSEQTRSAEALRDELDKISARLSSKKHNQDALRQELQKTRRDYELLRSQSERETGTSAELDSLRVDIDQRESELALSQQEVALLQAEMHRRQADFSAQLRVAEQRDSLLSEQLLAQRRQTTDLAGQLEQSERKRVEAQQALNIEQLELAKQQILFDEKTSLLLALEQKYLRSAQDGNQLQAGEIERLEGELSSARQALGQRQRTIENLQQSVAALSRNVTQLELVAGPDSQDGDFVKTALEAVDFGSYHAMIIANRDYHSLADLGLPVASDARKLERLLKEKYGYKTKLLIDVDRAQIYQQLQIYQNQLGKRDNLLIYYAGRSKLSADRSQGYWLPVNADDKNGLGNWISNQEIANQLKIMRAKHVLVVSDSRYLDRMTDPPPLIDVATGLSQEAKIRRLANLSRLTVRTVLSSGSHQQQLEPETNEHSAFTGTFLQVLENNKNILEGQTLAGQISSRLRTSLKNIRQAAGYDAVRDAGHLFGDYLFVPKLVEI